MKKVLLSMATLAFVMSANAENLLTYDFESVDGSKIVSENWQEDTFPAEGNNFEFSKDGVGVDGSKALYVKTTADCQNWQRVIALLNTGVKENSAYKISLKVKGSGKINVGILKGCFNHDKALLLNGSDQVKDFDITDAENFQTIEYTVWSPSRAIMTAAKSDFSEDEYWNQDFLRLNFKGEGEYYVDDVVIEELPTSTFTVKSVTFSTSAIQIEYGFANNGSSLSNGTCYPLDLSSVKVVVDEEEQEAEYVEIMKNGKLGIFFSDEILSDESEVFVTFTNSDENYKFTSFEGSLDIEDYKATYDSKLTIEAYAYQPASLILTTPGNDSFEMPATTSEFTFVFDKQIKKSASLKAVLSASGFSENLVVDDFTLSESVVVRRPDGAAALEDNNYVVTLSGILNEANTKSENATISFEVGSVNVATTVYGAADSTLLVGTAAGAIPAGWTCMVKGSSDTPWTGGESWGGGSACRTMVTGDCASFYLCDRDGYTYLMYGDQEDALLTLPAGDVEFGVIATSHDTEGHELEFRLEDLDGNEVATGKGGSAIKGNDLNSYNGWDYISVKFNNESERNLILKIHAIGGGYTAVRIAGFMFRTYSLSEGDRYEPEVVLASNFSGTAMPALNEGWIGYNSNNQLTPGEARNGTSGLLGVNNGGMTTVFLFRECGSNDDAAHRLTYGEDATEKKFMLKNATYDINFKCATWNDDAGNAAGNSKIFFQIIDVATEQVVLNYEHVNSTTANFKNNAGTAGAEADNVSLKFSAKAGQYMIKVWGTQNTIWSNLSIEIPGKTAVKYHALLDAAVEAANDVLGTVQDAKYDGSTKTTLNSLVSTYSKYPNGMTTAEEYNDAIANLGAAHKAMSARRSAVDAYASDLVKLGQSLADVVGTKYENLEVIGRLTNLYNEYKDVEAISLEDAELISVQEQVTSGASGVGNAQNAVNKFLTKQIQNLIAEINANCESLDDEFALGWMSKGDNAIFDDQDIAEELKKILTACIYQKIANDTTVFGYYDEEAMTTITNTIAVTGYVANNMFYTVESNGSKGSTVSANAFPGWNIEGKDISNVWWWENPLIINDETLAVDASVRNLADKSFKVNQVLTSLPAGVFTMTMKTADMSNVSNIQDHDKDGKLVDTLKWSNSIVYAMVGEKKDTVEANYGQGQLWRNAAVTTLDSIVGVVESGKYTVTMTIGADMNCTRDAAQVDDVELTMIGKIEGFDYAAAATALFGSIPDELKAVKRTDAPVAVTYFNVNGQKAAAEKGVNIKVERYADGYTVVKKVIVK